MPSVPFMSNKWHVPLLGCFWLSKMCPYRLPNIYAFVLKSPLGVLETVRWTAHTDHITWQEYFDISPKVSKLLYNPVSTPEATIIYEWKGVRLSKLEVPTFDDDILHWQTFWEQFCVAIYDCSDISDTQKLVYLCHSLKDGTANFAIEGLFRSGEHYAKAVECLKSRYSCPC